MEPRIFAYLRVSTSDQDVDKNRDEILRWADSQKLGPIHWVTETISGTKDWRKRELGSLIDSLGENDWLVTPEFSRLARSTLQILEILAELKRRVVNVYIIKGAQHVNCSIESKVFLTMMALFSEIERDLISARTREGLAARKRAGIVLGRPRGTFKSRLDTYKEEIIALLKVGVSRAHICRKYKCVPSTLHSWLRNNGVDVKELRG